MDSEISSFVKVSELKRESISEVFYSFWGFSREPFYITFNNTLRNKETGPLNP